MQRIIVIPDSFKGALSSREAGSAIATGLASATDAEVLVERVVATLSSRSDDYQGFGLSLIHI